MNATILQLAIPGLFIMVAAGSILYQTSAIMRTYPSDRYVGASLGLFASVALMFWYVVQLLMSFSGE